MLTIEFVEKSINSKAGWRSLALVALRSQNKDTKNQCIDLLKKIAGDKEIETVHAATGQKIKLKVAEMFVDMLERNIKELESEDDK